MSAVIHGVVDDAIGEFVQLLHLFAVHVFVAGQPKDLGQPGFVDLFGDDFEGDGQVPHQVGEFAGGGRQLSFLPYQMAADGQRGRVDGFLHQRQLQLDYFESLCARVVPGRFNRGLPNLALNEHRIKA